MVERSESLKDTIMEEPPTFTCQTHVHCWSTRQGGKHYFFPQSPIRCFWVFTTPVNITSIVTLQSCKKIETVKKLNAIGTTKDQRKHHKKPYNKQIMLRTWKSRDCLDPSPKDDCKASETAFMSTPSGINPKERKSFAKPRESRLTKCTSWKKQKVVTDAELHMVALCNRGGRGKRKKKKKASNGVPREKTTDFLGKSAGLS